MIICVKAETSEFYLKFFSHTKWKPHPHMRGLAGYRCRLHIRTAAGELG